MSKKKISIISKINIAIVILSILLCSIWAVKYFLDKNYYMMISSIAVMILPLLIYIYERIFKRDVPEIIKLLYLIFVFLSSVLGAVMRFYDTVFLYDKFVHFVSGLLTSGLVIFEFKKWNKKGKYNIWDLSYIIVSFSATIAVLWEIIEFVCDLTINKHFQKGLADTMLDMISAITASIIVTIIYVSKHKDDQQKSFKKATLK
jgi:hypothetical protein